MADGSSLGRPSYGRLTNLTGGLKGTKFKIIISFVGTRLLLCRGIKNISGFQRVSLMVWLEGHDTHFKINAE
jgi:hypothetical protein